VPSRQTGAITHMKAILALEDGRTFEGEAFGYTGTTTGEVCFNTSMTGYQEIITDPSYRGQIVTMTYPLIGNYGVNPEDAESAGPHVRGLVIAELSPVASNWRSRQSLPDYFAEHKIIGIEGVDTRALTKHLRSAGAMRSCISTELSAEEAIQAAKDSAPMAGSDFVKEVSIESTTVWDGESRLWTIPNPSTGQEGNYIELPPVKYNIVAYDFGIKRNILRMLRQAGFEVTLVNSRTSAEDVLAMKPDGRPCSSWVYSRRSKKTSRQNAYVWHLPWSPDSYARIRRQNLQTEIWSPWRKPTRQRPSLWQSIHHRSEPRFCVGCRQLA